MAEHYRTEPTVLISCGDGVDLFIGEDECIWVRESQGTQILSEVRLGRATTKRFIELQNYLGRLIVHAVAP